VENKRATLESGRVAEVIGDLLFTVRLLAI
jgi:hypothetical protein